jgi:hypothetical protein
LEGDLPLKGHQSEEKGADFMAAPTSSPLPQQVIDAAPQGAIDECQALCLLITHRLRAMTSE